MNILRAILNVLYFPFRTFGNLAAFFIREGSTFARYLATRTIARREGMPKYAQLRQQHRDGVYGGQAFESAGLARVLNWLVLGLIPLGIYAMDLEAWMVKLGMSVLLGLMLMYFTWLFFRRTQAGLMENILGMIVLGNIEGLVLSTPGLWSDPFTAALLGMAVGCWVLKSMVFGAVQAQLLESHSAFKRSLLIILHLGYALAPALMVIGLAFEFTQELPKDIQMYIDPGRQTWGKPLLVSAAIFVVSGIILEVKTRGVARAVVEREWAAKGG